MTLPIKTILSSSSLNLQPASHVIIGGGSSFLMHPEKFGFTPEDGPNLSDSKYLAIGAHKSVRYVEGPKGRGYKHAGLIVESNKKTPFHIANQSLFEKARAILGPNAFGSGGSIRPHDISRIHSQFKTLHVEVHYGNTRGRDVRISGVKPPRLQILCWKCMENKSVYWNTMTANMR
uniref:Uncharacterized protein n=1 Tax=Ditylenchus dipsaci TaxID=166011 RepID=A0A915E221_9BILA